MLCKASHFKPITKLLNGVHELVWLLTLLEGGGVHKMTVQRPNFACEGLHQHANGHT